MGRTTAARYVVPYAAGLASADPVAATFSPGADTTLTGRGVYTLAANTTYYFQLAEDDAKVSSVELEIDAQIVITAALIEDTDVQKSEAPFHVAGAPWVPETPSTSYVATVGMTAPTTTNATLATAGGAAGAAIWHFADSGTQRSRFKIQVGAMGGEARVSFYGKD